MAYRYVVRIAKGTDRQQGKRWVARVETPAGRIIPIERTRRKPQAVVASRRAARVAVTAEAKSTGAQPAGGGSVTGGTPPIPAVDYRSAGYPEQRSFGGPYGIITNYF